MITEHAGKLDPSEVSKSIEQMQSLKLHPRDDAANQTVLKWAERVYKELAQLEGCGEWMTAGRERSF